MEISRHWRLKKQRYNLIGSVCPDCGRPEFPPREVCSGCANGKNPENKFSPTVESAVFIPAVIELAESEQ